MEQESGQSYMKGQMGSVQLVFSRVGQGEGAKACEPILVT